MSKVPSNAHTNEVTTGAFQVVSDDDLLSIFKIMILTRTLDSKIMSIQRQGRIGPFVPCSGEEAAMVGSAYALKKEDWMISSYREMGSHLVRGSSVDSILAQLYGNRNDLLKGRQMSNSWGDRSLNIVPTAAPIGAYLPVAVGISLAFRLKKKNNAVLTYFGDGGTSASDFHTAMNFAGVYRTPTVFFCRNNGWAISLPVSKQTASESLAVKALAYGFEGIQVDGNDAEKVFAVTRNALEKARSGGGPTLIEAMTYRVGPHSTADDPNRYRTKEEAEKWSKKDPIEILRNKLVSKGLWNEQKEKELVSRYEKEIAASIERQESSTPLPPGELFFDDVYVSMPWNLKEQRRELTEYLEEESSQ
ncbi:MAG: thiamine pyrophosphate-dependent dehydrogenase E1 component subunit alpha [Thaumarchaeota archaeon]|nr:thiamine pyrophosphate-dependent dehydrogenase E1 component subunit alpha [Nitrososphaerota archaeon]MCL5068364.1 thiamine pyrophosphate-dependent dehydrogenase E1 component subunit alpha [Nitrososphaerota archaeon]MDG6907455.1 thiamine pyrophosphate-dependent dehydrogenase E1 component subunit alpha [Nitrososphaerota archaeon]